MHMNLDSQLVDKIANEVKSQGVFDQFRKDSMADVDTKPAYQNLRQRVENTVNKFLSEQKWTPDLNKNQLRERLRKHITEAGFLDVGVERIVDQVVNPKIATVFQPKIEDIAYKYLGIPKPQVKINNAEVPTLNGMLTIETDLMPTDLEQVSPDSDKGTNKSDSKDDIELDDKMDDFESPPFEPIEIKPNNHDIDMNEDIKKEEIITETTETLPVGNAILQKEQNVENNIEKVKIENSALVKIEDEREIIISGEVSQESQLSQVSSDSRLSIVTNDNTQDEHTVACKIKEENNVNISEEAQMPKFNENSNSSSEKKSSVPLHFDIKKDEIKFEGTERKLEPHLEELSPNTSEEIRLDSSLENKIVDNSQNNDCPLPSHEYSFEKEKEFKFSKIEVSVDQEEVTKTASLDDSADRELQIIEKAEISQCSVSQQSIKSPTTKQEKLTKPSSATSSPSQHKTSSREKEHSSSSRHKKHSRDRRSEKERHSSSGGHKASSSSSLKHHNSSKSSSSHKVSGTSSDYHHHRSSSSSVHKSRHTSKNGKSSRSHHDSKDSHSRDHSKSKSDKSDKIKEKSSKDKSEQSKTSDDHYSSKQKWRNSTDSNDEGDSSRDEHRTCVPKDNSSSRDNATNGTLNSSNTSSGNSAPNNPSDAGVNADTPCSNNIISQNIVILDNLLENPKTNFIEIRNAHFQVNTSSNQSPHCAYDGDSLYYFENDNQSKNDFGSRIKMLTHNMEDIRKLLQTNLDFPRKLSTTESDGNTSFEMEKNHMRPDSASPRSCAMKRHFESPNTPPSLTSATLTIDCIQYGNTSTSNCLSKRFKFNGTSVTKVSPTPSELSVNSKENEFVDKNAQSDSESSGYPDNTKREISKTISEKRNKVVNRNQRYSSEDLYKPRPILSQRSRRRGLDAII